MWSLFAFNKTEKDSFQIYSTWINQNYAQEIFESSLFPCLYP